MAGPATVGPVEWPEGQTIQTSPFKMNLPKYHLKAESEFTRFEFTSEGKKGAIRKLIEFQATTDPEVYNLAFGDKDPSTGETDDLAVSDNGDTEKVLATITDALYVFFDKHPTSYVYATGSTKARTRLYRMGITRFHDEMQNDFYLYGQIGDSYLEFELDKEYDGFLAQKDILTKLPIMKTVEELNKRKLPIVAIDPALDKYRNKIMFPEKLEKANKMLKTAKLPPNKNLLSSS